MIDRPGVPIQALLPFLDFTSQLRLFLVNVTFNRKVSEIGAPTAPIPTVKAGQSLMRQIKHIKLDATKWSTSFTGTQIRSLSMLISLKLNFLHEKKKRGLELSLSHLTNLTFLDIHGYRKSSFSLANLSNLISLRMTHCAKITDDAIRHLSSLSTLDIYQTSITGITLSSLTNLIFLRISSNRLSPFCQISQLTKLETLVIYTPSGPILYPITQGDTCPAFPIDSIISLFTKLKTLSLHTLERKDEATDNGLSTLTNLTDLSLSQGENVSDKSISLLINLKYLNLQWCTKVTDKSISQLTSLLILRIRGGEHIRGNCFRSLVNLTELEFNVKRFPQREMKHLTNLKRLTIRITGSFPINEMDYLTNLEQVMFHFVGGMENREWNEYFKKRKIKFNLDLDYY
ncbi:MAG: hypothetical protein Hyperionvirus10_11 [Hyperionvirus sp.]|uniref:Leucine-rich repeat protein n=1 Tax=Hyperionvirus sp. TaxID=2487770 RepID=A0A3G5A8W4_9VIRU|nr:MAG: hypothetical protein Hyperionvirus10_11 [Hyperionvirus sp.]